jgi:ADP-ribose pyrophosphatase YjhB (NUDIX family)
MINMFKVIVSGFVTNAEGQLLVIRRADDEESFPGMLAIPGGTVEADEMNGVQMDTVENNLVREILEETNVNVKVVKWLESSCIAKEGKAKLYLFFGCELIGDGKDTATSEETPEVFWADISSIALDECTPALKQYIQTYAN